jgi:hypothetical protein
MTTVYSEGGRPGVAGQQKGTEEMKRDTTAALDSRELPCTVGVYQGTRCLAIHGV